MRGPGFRVRSHGSLSNRPCTDLSHHVSVVPGTRWAHLPRKHHFAEVFLPGRLFAEQKECLAHYSLAPFSPGLDMWHQSQINTCPLLKFHKANFWSRRLIQWFKYLTPLKARKKRQLRPNWIYWHSNEDRVRARAQESQGRHCCS